MLTDKMEVMDTEMPLEEERAFEDGEIGESDEEGKASVRLSNSTSAYANNVGGFTTGFNIFDVNEDVKRIERAKRFALDTPPVQTLNKIVLDRLYNSLGVDSETVRHYRLNAIHVRGTEDMSTEDVFNYFSSYAAASIEWINDVSCNVLWLDDISAARAMLSLSKEIRNLSKVQGNGNPFKDDIPIESIEEEMLNDVKMEEPSPDSVDACDIKCPIPPGYWRLGLPSDKAKNILMRFATNSDRKQPNAQKNSEYYKKYGNPRFGYLTGLISSSHKARFLNKNSKRWKRRNSERNRSDGEPSDDEFSDIQNKKNPWGAIAQKWSNIESREKNSTETKVSDYNTIDLRESLSRRLGEKAKYVKLEYDPDEKVDTQEEWVSRRKLPRMKMHADDEEKKTEQLTKLKQFDKLTSVHNRLSPDLRSRVQTRTQKSVLDLRNLITTKSEREQIYSLRETSRGVWTKVAVESTGEGQSDSSKDDSETGSTDSSSSSDSDSSSSSADGRDPEDWALEEYKDLRETLQKSRKPRPGFVENTKVKIEHKGDSDDDDEEDSDFSNINLVGRRSPLQIEIDNDEYYKHNRK